MDSTANFLYELRYALKAQDRNLGAKYVDIISNEKTWVSNIQNKIYTTSIFKKQLDNNLHNNTDCIGVNIFSNSDVIVIDYDGDHKLGFKNEGKNVLNKIVSLFGVDPFFIEWKKTGNFHAWFKLNRKWNKDEKIALEDYLKTINESIEEFSSKNKVIRLPFSSEYRYDEYGVLLSAEEMNDMIENIDSSKHISSITPNEFIFLKKQKEIDRQQDLIDSPIFLKKEITKDGNFFKDFQFSEGNRNEEWMKYGYIIYGIHNQDVDLTVEYILSHAGSSKDLNSSNAEKIAKEMVLNTAKSFDSKKISLSVSKSNKIYDNHLLSLTDKQKCQIKDLCGMMDRAYNITTSKYKKVRQDNQEALEFTVSWMITHMQYQYDEIIPNKIVSDKVRIAKRNILENSFAFYFEVMYDYFKLHFPNNNANLKKLYLKVRDIFENSSIIMQTLHHSSYEGFRWKKQWNILFKKNILDNITVVLAKINKSIINPIKEKYKDVVAGNSSSYSFSQRKTKILYGNISNVVSLDNDKKEEDSILNDEDFDWLESKFPELKQKSLKFA